MNVILLERTQIKDDTAVIASSDLYKHITGVLNVEVGDTLKIGVIDGNLGSAIITSINDSEITLSNINLNQPPPSKINLTVVLALPRPKVLRRLIMDMTALGVARIVLVNSYKTQKSYWQSPLLNRIDEFVKEGLQQGVDTIAPIIEFKKRFKPFIEDELPAIINTKNNVQNASLKSPSINALVAHPYTTNNFSKVMYNVIKASAKLPHVLCIGAEGGWIDYEIELLKQQGCLPVSLGKRILRTEAAVNVLCGFWLSNQT